MLPLSTIKLSRYLNRRLKTSIAMKPFFHYCLRLLSVASPLLAICRGFQELDVFFGGTLHRAVHERPDALDHREGNHDRPLTCWYQDIERC